MFFRAIGLWFSLLFVFPGVGVSVCCPYEMSLEMFPLPLFGGVEDGLVLIL